MSSQRTEQIIKQFFTSGEVKTRAYEEIGREKFKFLKFKFFQKNIFDIFFFIFEIIFLK